MHPPIVCCCWIFVGETCRTTPKSSSSQATIRASPTPISRRSSGRPGAPTTSSPSGCRTCTASAAISRPAACSRSAWSSWQVLVALLVGILDRARSSATSSPNPVSRPARRIPVICRAPFGVLGANIPAIIRGLIAVAWYGIQTYLASSAFMVVALKFFPGLAPYADVHQFGFVGLSALGWAAFIVLWVPQALVFWRGMEAIRIFIDWAGPGRLRGDDCACGLLVCKAGVEPHQPDARRGEVRRLGRGAGHAERDRAGGLATSRGPMLNFGDFSRYGKIVRRGEDGEFLGPAGQLPRLLAADRDHDVGDVAGVRSARSPIRSRP